VLGEQPRAVTLQPPNLCQEVEMKHYRTPKLIEHGDIAQLTAVVGGAYTGDVLIDVNGEVIQEGNQSIDACPTPDHEVCL